MLTKILQLDVPCPADGWPTLEQAWKACERDLILRTLEKTDGNVGKAAKLLEVCVHTMSTKITAHGLRGKVREFREQRDHRRDIERLRRRYPSILKNLFSYGEVK